MIEARIFTANLEDVRAILQTQKATNKGRYKIIDEIFRSRDTSVPLIDEFLRLRVVPENIWEDKEVILAIKKTRPTTIGKNSDIPLKLQFDKREDAETHYAEHLRDQYVRDFTFSRIGWQYIMPSGDVVDLEIIENDYPSIEFKSKTAEGVEKLLALFDISREKVITGPSVVAVRELLKV